jgi:hypothetical protein
MGCAEPDRCGALPIVVAPGSADHGGNALVTASLPIVVGGHTTMGRSHRNYTTAGRTVELHGDLSAMFQEP